MFCGRGRHLEREAVTNGARKNINQNVRNLRTEVELEADTQKGGEGMGQGVVEHVKHWAIKFATCSHVHSWAEAAVAMMGPLLPFNRGTAEAGREGAQQRVEAKDNFLMCFLPCGPLITPCHRATQPDRETRPLWHVLNLIALQIAWLNKIYK